MYLLVGLGNPGKQYERTRHNLGFLAVDAIKEYYQAPSYQNKFEGEWVKGNIDHHEILVFKPHTFMNVSGRAVQNIMQFFKLSLEHVIVFHDDLDLPVGKVKIKRGGGAGGHNGLRSLDHSIGPEYQRVRIGIGHPGKQAHVTPYVLGAVSDQEYSLFLLLFQNIAKYMPILLSGNQGLFIQQLFHE